MGWIVEMKDRRDFVLRFDAENMITVKCLCEKLLSYYLRFLLHTL